mmetsp:Transcript_325/g.1183  ORF Transcript_325/g.1183 Transcript_325/m.1183 type:complete len:96 (+) Transcript_325:84-371(+)|eukprot:CAMPEP_0118911486 /NCGR_PEP_ID=MMETSP1166-20130328/13155_1 /TAXON_ID=1104430 /ORGANISM="Chrysoreinhardia sp, Strain CCMP3193" /LENGTH=95 /DNA_ID=CAMNT_0006850977 /DNA_START=21 /DNA_END=308 /DNA_ORIENTATION=-
MYGLSAYPLGDRERGRSPGADVSDGKKAGGVVLRSSSFDELNAGQKKERALLSSPHRMGKEDERRSGIWMDRRIVGFYVGEEKFARGKGERDDDG